MCLSALPPEFRLILLAASNLFNKGVTFAARLCEAVNPFSTQALLSTDTEEAPRGGRRSLMNERPQLGDGKGASNVRSGVSTVRQHSSQTAAP